MISKSADKGSTGAPPPLGGDAPAMGIGVASVITLSPPTVSVSKMVDVALDGVVTVALGLDVAVAVTKSPTGKIGDGVVSLWVLIAPGLDRNAIGSSAPLSEVAWR